ncbi:M23 family metallopeptidase [Nocardioides pantholopis]|uniref:M23 family metallopeptidase n=1 Tax=Nocardioides pantholopis TaxID=2483798 RepID=UPI0013DE2690|nr:M23 family metallopeptidase [Nocardioides pantholopis]
MLDAVLDVAVEVTTPPVVPAARPLDPARFGLAETVVRVEDEPAAALDSTTLFGDDDRTEQLPLVQAQPGRRKAVKPTRGSRLRALPPVPVLLGVAALAVSASGAALTVGETVRSSSTTEVPVQASALSGFSSSATIETVDRRAVVSRSDNSRQALADTAESELVAAAEQQNRLRADALGELAAQAEKQAEKIKLNQWVLPINGYRLTAEFGDYGLWANYHTGLDFAAPTGTPILAVANGTITETGYDGAYGNKTVLTLEDGTEVWLCHQTTVNVSVGDQVRAGEQIGTVGSTGNVTGPHLHLEVRPGAGDPVDPYAALSHHGITP